MSFGNPNLRNAVSRILPSNLEYYRILDLGCGFGFWAWYLTVMHKAKNIHGLDIQEKEIKACISSGLYKSILQLDLSRDPLYFGKYDLTICCEILEHLKKKRALKVLRALEKQSKHIIITVPENEKQFRTYSKNPYTKHRSTWNKKDFNKLGYQTRTVYKYTSRAFKLYVNLLKIIKVYPQNLLAWK